MQVVVDVDRARFISRFMPHTPSAGDGGTGPGQVTSAPRAEKEARTNPGIKSLIAKFIGDPPLKVK